VRRTLAVSLAVFLPLGCSGSGSKPDAAKSKAAPPPEPPAAADADTDADEAEAPERDASPPVRVGPEADGDKVSEAAIVYDPKGLYLLSVEDGSQYVPFSGFVHACLAHPAADTIWLVGTPEGATDTRLWALDLRRDANAFALAENVPPQIHAIAVDTWKGGTVRSAMESEFTVGLMVDLRSVPVTRRWIGCSSEMLDCYDDPAAETLREPLAKLANAADAVRLTDAGVAKRLGDRAEKPSRPVLPPTTAKLEVPSEACREEPNDCGRTRGIAGTGLQLVVTSFTRCCSCTTRRRRSSCRWRIRPRHRSSLTTREPKSTVCTSRARAGPTRMAIASSIWTAARSPRHVTCAAFRPTVRC
jgi:hypothetical protein